MTVGSPKPERQPVAKLDAWKGKTPYEHAAHGQWKEQSKEKVGFAVVSVKLRPAEKIEFQALCKGLSVSPNAAMRSMVRQAAGFLEVDGSVLDEMRALTRQISGVAVNINQIAKAGNRTLNPDFAAFMEDRRALGKELARLEQMMQHILNVGRRRSDGLARLQQVLKTT